MRSRIFGIRSKLIIPTLSVVLLFALFIHLVWAPNHTQRLAERFKQSQQLLLQTIEPQISHTLQTRDFANLLSYLDVQFTLHKEYWASVQLELTDGTRVYPLSPPPSAEATTHVHNEFILQQSIYDSTQQPLATLTIHLDWNSQKAAINSDALQLEIFLLLSVLSIVLLSGLLQTRLVLNPIIKLTHTVERLKPHQYELDIEHSRHDEVGDLIAQIRQMLQQRQHDDELLQQHTAQLHRAKEKAEQALAAKSNFLATMSHEIRTPMNGILGMLNLVEETTLNEQQQRYIEMANGSAKSLLVILNDILDFSKIEAGKLEIENINFDVQQLICNFAEAATLQAEQKGLEFLVDLEHLQHPYIKSDPTRLHQILNNLLSNSIKFTNQGSITLTVGSQREGENIKLTLQIQDTGIGIPADKIHMLFESFTQVDSSTTRKYGGTGLGLAIVKKLAQLMDGDVQVTSAINHGSTFTVTLLAEHGEIQPIEHNPVTAQTQRHNGIKARILLVEDNFINQQVALNMLQAQGHQVEIAHDGTIALQRLTEVTQDHFQLILMDCQMPELDGYKTTEHIREHPHYQLHQHLPIIAMTANAMPGDRERCLACGMNDYLSKPLDPRQLQKTIQHWLKAK